MNLDADPYRTLGLTRGASLDDVKRAYRRLAKANHPDVAGAAALPRFLAIRAAYEQLASRTATSGPGGGTAPNARRRQAPGSAGSGRPGRADGGTAPRPGARPGRPTGDASAPGRRSAADSSSTSGRARGGPDKAGATGQPADGASPKGSRASAGGTTRASGARGKATLGSTSYDGADAGPFEPDWGGASWYGTTSGTYWTINPKEYADPRKHGPEYQARARRAAVAKPGASGVSGAASGRDPRRADEAAGPSTHTTTSWWEPTSGPEPQDDDFAMGDAGSAATADAGPASRGQSGRAHAEAIDVDELAPDPARAAIDLGRALTDPRSGGLRGRTVRAVIGWLPIALGLGWLVGELTGCGRFAATCDPAVAPLAAVGQGIVLVVLFLIPEIAAITAGAALVLLATATSATLILSAGGSAADEGSRRAALAALLMVAWLSGLGIAIVRRVRSGSRPARPVS